MRFKTQEDFTDKINKLILEGKEQGFSTKNISDKWHTFEELYYHRMILFSIILNQNKDISWKAKKHHDGTMFNEDSFICGIETPEGQYTYHYKLKYWDKFDVKELEYAPEYDGHKPEDIVRLISLRIEEREEAMGAIRTNTVREETVPYPYFMLFVIYNKKERAWHKGGMKEFVPSKYVTGAKMYQSCTYAEKVAIAICEEGQDINDFVVLRYEARATEAIVCDRNKEI